MDCEGLGHLAALVSCASEVVLLLFRVTAGSSSAWMLAAQHSYKFSPPSTNFSPSMHGVKDSTIGSAFPSPESVLRLSHNKKVDSLPVTSTDLSDLDKRRIEYSFWPKNRKESNRTA